MSSRSFKFAIGTLAAAVFSTAATATDLTFFKTVFNTDFTAVGIGGLRNGAGTATLNLSGVTGPVSEAYLYWHGPTNIATADAATANSNISFAGTAITGTYLGISSDNCWGFANSVAYRADVTSLITGNGNYSLANFIKTGVQINGFSLIVFFDDGDDTNNRDVVMFNGNDSNINNPFDAPGWNITLSGINYTDGTANLQFHVADGQTFADDAIRINGDVFVPAGNVFQGTNAQNGGSGFPGNGLLWDINTYNVTSLLNPGLNTLNITTGVASDCLACVLIAIDLPAGAAPPPPNGTPEPGSLALLGGALLAGFGARRLRRK